MAVKTDNATFSVLRKINEALSSLSQERRTLKVLTLQSKNASLARRVVHLENDNKRLMKRCADKDAYIEKLRKSASELQTTDLLNFKLKAEISKLRNRLDANSAAYVALQDRNALRLAEMSVKFEELKKTFSSKLESSRNFYESKISKKDDYITSLKEKLNPDEDSDVDPDLDSTDLDKGSSSILKRSPFEDALGLWEHSESCRLAHQCIAYPNRGWATCRGRRCTAFIDGITGLPYKSKPTIADFPEDQKPTEPVIDVEAIKPAKEPRSAPDDWFDESRVPVVKSVTFTRNTYNLDRCNVLVNNNSSPVGDLSVVDGVHPLSSISTGRPPTSQECALALNNIPDPHSGGSGSNLPVITGSSLQGIKPKIGSVASSSNSTSFGDKPKEASVHPKVNVTGGRYFSSS